MRYSVRHKTDDAEIDHIQFEVGELASQQVVLIGAGILYIRGLGEGDWCVYDDTNTPLPQGDHVSETYRDDDLVLSESEPTEFFDIDF